MNYTICVVNFISFYLEPSYPFISWKPRPSPWGLIGTFWYAEAACLTNKTSRVEIGSSCCARNCKVLISARTCLLTARDDRWCRSWSRNGDVGRRRWRHWKRAPLCSSCRGIGIKRKFFGCLVCRDCWVRRRAVVDARWRANRLVAKEEAEQVLSIVCLCSSPLVFDEAPKWNQRIKVVMRAPGRVRGRLKVPTGNCRASCIDELTCWVVRENTHHSYWGRLVAWHCDVAYVGDFRWRRLVVGVDLYKGVLVRQPWSLTWNGSHLADERTHSYKTDLWALCSFFLLFSIPINDSIFSSCVSLLP